MKKEIRKQLKTLATGSTFALALGASMIACGDSADSKGNTQNPNTPVNLSGGRPGGTPPANGVGNNPAPALYQVTVPQACALDIHTNESPYYSQESSAQNHIFQLGFIEVSLQSDDAVLLASSAAAAATHFGEKCDAWERRYHSRRYHGSFVINTRTASNSEIIRDQIIGTCTLTTTLDHVTEILSFTIQNLGRDIGVPLEAADERHPFSEAEDFCHAILDKQDPETGEITQAVYTPAVDTEAPTAAEDVPFTGGADSEEDVDDRRDVPHSWYDTTEAGEAPVYYGGGELRQ